MADESEVGAVTYKLDKFAEVNEVNKIIESIPKATETLTQTEGDLERLTIIFDRYQEQPHLLDPYLGNESFMSKLLSVVKNEISNTKISSQAFKYLYLITKVRGPKYIVRLFPHEVEHVEAVLSMLGNQNHNDHETWETRYILLLWLSIVCMVPFDMSRFDGNITQTSNETPIVDRILENAKLYLDAFDKSRDAAALVIAKFVTRPDVKLQNLSKFFTWSLEELCKTDANTLNGIITITGILTTLALLFKHGKRADLINDAHRVRETVDSCKIIKINNNLLRKLYIKLIQRLGLTFLKPRIAAWRYERGTRSLSYNLANPYQTNTTVHKQIGHEKDLDENFDIPDDIEDIIEQLLIGLKDKDTIVRWSAAKGVGRITGRLPEDLADDIVGAVLELFSFQETDSAWHGGCLALAELGRRGLLLPQRLSEVVPVVLKALQYDERRGACSVGSNVRDAACYVCWSFARAYEPKDIKPYVNDIACGLIITTLFDREINCRRAASAAFQENVGRQGTFPHGIDILTTADYFEVGKRMNTYLTISVYIAQYKEYCRALIDHLYKVKINHWDIAIRELASKALYNLTARDPTYMATKVLPAILPLTVGLDLDTRHGSILCSAEITHALHCFAKENNRTLKDVLDSNCCESLELIVPKLTEAKLFRGLGGELMRPAVCHLIEKLSLSNFQCHRENTVEVWQQTIDDNLGHQQRPIQEKAVSALRALTICYRQTLDGKVILDAPESLIKNYTEKLKSSFETEREGYGLALGALPKFMFENNLLKVIGSLLEAVMVPGKDPGKFAQSRADALHSLANIADTVGLESDGDDNMVINKSNLKNLYQSCFSAMNDYTTDSRGDVGASVREASMSCLLKLTMLIVKVEPEILDEELCCQIVCSLFKQASEKIDRTRSLAGEIVLKLVYCDNPKVPNIPSHDSLLEIFPRKDCEQLNWSAPADCFPRIAQLLELPCYQYSVLSGLVLSVGGLTESLIRQSSLSLQNFLVNISESDDALMDFAQNLVKLFKEFQKNDRVIVPLFNVLDFLFSNGSLTFLAKPDRSNITEMIFEATKYEIDKISDAKKIITSINVAYETKIIIVLSEGTRKTIEFCGLLQFPGNARRRSLQCLCMFLCHKYPRVRKSTADSLYTALITYDDIVSEDDLDEVLNILSETVWDNNVQNIRPERNKLCDLFGIPKPVLKNISKVKPTSSKSGQDSFSSYKDLVSRDY